MNERIRAHDLWTQVCQEDMPELDETFMTMRRTRKFAQLIVQECADVIQKDVSMKYKDGGETEEFMGGHYAGSLLARVRIKRHFGVTE
jgi:hypothetical protein